MLLANPVFRTRPVMERTYAKKLAELDVTPSPQKPIKVAKVDPVFSEDEDEYGNFDIILEDH